MKRPVWCLVMLLVMYGLVNPAPLSAQSVLEPITLQNAKSLKPVMRLGDGLMLDSAWSPDEKTLAVGSTLGLSLFSVGEGAQSTPLRQLETFGEVDAVTFSPDGQTLLAASSDGKLRWLDTSTWKTSRTIDLGSAQRSLVYSPDGGLIAGGGDNSIISLVDAKTGTLRASLDDIGHMSNIFKLVFSSDGRRLAVVTAGGRTWLWNIADGKAERVFTRQDSQIGGVFFSADGRHLYTANDSSLYDWNVANGKILRVADLQAVLYDLAISSDRHTLFYQNGNAIISHDLISGNEHQAAHLDSSDVARLLLSQDGKRLLTMGFSTPGVLLDLVKGTPLQRFERRGLSFAKVAFSPRSRLLATGGSNGQIALWNLDRAGAVDVLGEQFGAVNQLVFSPDGKLLASADRDTRIYLWNVADQKLQATLRLPKLNVFSIAFSPDGKYLVSSGSDKILRLWDVAAAKQVSVHAMADPSPLPLAFLANGQLAVGYNQEVQLWDPLKWKLLRTFPLSALNLYVNYLAGSPDGKQLAISGYGVLVILDPATGTHLQEIIPRPATTEQYLAFSPDSSFLTGANNYSALFVRDPGTGRPLIIPAVNDSPSTDVALSADQSLIATGSYDGTVIIWGVEKR